jgi:hypothetical protein
MLYRISLALSVFALVVSVGALIFSVAYGADLPIPHKPKVSVVMKRDKGPAPVYAPAPAAEPPPAIDRPAGIP